MRHIVPSLIRTADASIPSDLASCYLRIFEDLSAVKSRNAAVYCHFILPEIPGFSELILISKSSAKHSNFSKVPDENFEIRPVIVKFRYFRKKNHQI